MNYNSRRKKIKLPEYGRIIQELVEHAMTIEDREKRNLAARDIIRQMAVIKQNNIKDSEEFEKKLWTHLFIISDFKLDVDAPFPLDELKPNEKKQPHELKYNNQKSETQYRFYGTIIPEMIKKAAEMPDGEEKQALILDIANNMKKLYINWNKTSVDNSVIIKHLEELSNGKIKLNEDAELISSRQILNKNGDKKKMKKNHYYKK